MLASFGDDRRLFKVVPGRGAPMITIAALLKHGGGILKADLTGS